MMGKENELLPKLSMIALLDYEVRSSWWAKYISWGWGQTLSSNYFAWKVGRKYAAYNESKIWEERIKNKNLSVNPNNPTQP